MKKVILGISSVLVTSLLLLAACNKSKYRQETNVSQRSSLMETQSGSDFTPEEELLISQLKNDATFISFVNNAISSYSDIDSASVAALSTLFADGTIDETELEEAIGYMGFASMSDFEIHVNNLDVSANYLNFEYDFSNLSTNLVGIVIGDLVDEGTLNINIPVGTANCETTFKNCQTAVLTQYIVMLAGCTATGPVALLCMAAALVWEINGSNGCLNNYKACVN